MALFCWKYCEESKSAIRFCIKCQFQAIMTSQWRHFEWFWAILVYFFQYAPINHHKILTTLTKPTLYFRKLTDLWNPNLQPQWQVSICWAMFSQEYTGGKSPYLLLQLLAWLKIKNKLYFYGSSCVKRWEKAYFSPTSGHWRNICTKMLNPLKYPPPLSALPPEISGTPNPLIQENSELSQYPL